MAFVLIELNNYILSNGLRVEWERLDPLLIISTKKTNFSVAEFEEKFKYIESLI